MFILDGIPASIGVGAGTGNVRIKEAELADARSDRDRLATEREQDTGNSGSSQTVSGGGQSTEVSAPKSSGPRITQGQIGEKDALIAQLEGEISGMRAQDSTKEGQERANNQNQVKQNNPSLGV